MFFILIPSFTILIYVLIIIKSKTFVNKIKQHLDRGQVSTFDITYLKEFIVMSNVET